MKKLLLLTGISAISLAAFADNHPDPTKIDDAFIQKISPNGKYAVSNVNQEALVIYNLENGEVYSYKRANDYSPELYYFGIGQSINDSGILVGGQTDETAEYWKDGNWHMLSTADRTSTMNAANAISNDGSRICGFIGLNEFSYSDDVLMVEPCIWNAEGDGYGDPVVLPYPEKDIFGRVPQFVKAIDISGDGSIVIGEVVDATGRFNYPILYKEDAEGKWSYEIPHPELLMPAGFELPENPGSFNEPQPSYEDYMTPEQSRDYNNAIMDYYNGSLNVFPKPDEFMSPENAEEYNKVMAEYQEKEEAWNVKWNAYNDALDEISAFAAPYQENSERISNDGLTYGCTLARVSGPWSMIPSTYHVMICDVNSDKITKYEQQDNLCLTYLANGGVAAASTPLSVFSANPNNSFILKDGEVTGMYEWMNSKVPEYASWMKQNMEIEYWTYDEETYDRIKKKEFMTGYAVSNPDLSIMALSIQNLGFEDDDAWDDPDYNSIMGYGFIFNLNEGTAVSEVRPAAEGRTIYDLSGRKLKEVSAPGIYIINGKKKVVR